MSEESKETRKVLDWLTIFAIPTGLAIAGWVAVVFDEMRITLVHQTDDIAEIRQTMTHHTAQLDYIWSEIVKRDQHASSKP